MGYAIYRSPTEQEIADAIRYIEAEFVLKPDGAGEIHLDEVHWTEGLAFGPGRQMPGDESHRISARQVMPQLSDFQWKCLAASADRERSNQGMATLYTTGYVGYGR